MHLLGKTALITGAGRGIGAAAAHALARAGASVAVAARRLEDAESVAAAITAAGGAAVPTACDVRDFSSVQAAVAIAKREFGGVDILINNAGVIQPIARLMDSEPSAWLDAVETNLTGAYHAIRATLPGMLTRGGGVIVNLSSGAAFRPLEGWSAYCASKAGLAMLTRSLHEEYGSAGVRAIGFSPGLVDTDMQSAIRASGLNPVSGIARDALSNAAEPAAALAFLCGTGGAAYAGQEVDIRNAEFRAAAGLPIPP